jgi:hypothetical protein
LSRAARKGPMNLMMLIAMLSLFTGSFFVILDHQHYAQHTVKLLEKRLIDDYLIEGLLAYGQALYKKHGAAIASHYEGRYKPAGKDRCSLTFKQNGNHMHIGASIAGSSRTLQGLAIVSAC